MAYLAGVLILTTLGLSVDLMSADEEVPGAPAFGNPSRAEPRAGDSEGKTGAGQTDGDGPGWPEDIPLPSDEPTQEKVAPQTQAIFGDRAFAVFDDHYVTVTEETFGAAVPDRGFLSSLERPIGESWQRAILDEIRHHGPFGHQDHTLFLRGKAF